MNFTLAGVFEVVCSSGVDLNVAKVKDSKYMEI